MTNDRRRAEKESLRLLKAQLNEDQAITLMELERYGWELKFIRKPPFKPPIPVVFDPSGQKFAVLENDGSLNEKPGFTIRK